MAPSLRLADSLPSRPASAPPPAPPPSPGPAYALALALAVLALLASEADVTGGGGARAGGRTTVDSLRGPPPPALPSAVPPAAAAAAEGAALSPPTELLQAAPEWRARAVRGVAVRDSAARFDVYSLDYDGSPFHDVDFWGKAERGEWEPQTFVVLRRMLEARGGVAGGASFLDFGSWIGPTVLFGAHFAAHTYSLEPDPVAAAVLVANLELPGNAALRGRTRAFHECISLARGVQRMAGSGDSSSRVVRDDSTAPPQDAASWDVPCRTLPQFVAEEGVRNLGLIKLDVEGFELNLVPALRPWLEALDASGEGKPAIWLSLHRPFWQEGISTLAGEDAAESRLCATWRVASLYNFVYDNSLADISDAFRRDKEAPAGGGAHCAALLCANFCELLLTDIPL